MQYFVCMIDYLPTYKDGIRITAGGMEAVVDPEATRREIIAEVRDVLASNNRSLVHVKFVDGNYIDDITAEIVAEASQMEAA